MKTFIFININIYVKKYNMMRELFNFRKLYNTCIKNLHILKFCIYNNILSKMNKHKKILLKENPALKDGRSEFR